MLKLLPAEVKLVDTRYGLMLYPANDVFIGPSLLAYGEYCKEEGAAFRQLIKPGDVVADVGANIGSHTLLYSELVGPAGQVYAFEPQRQIFQILCGNLALNNISNVDARRQGLGRSRDTLRVSTPSADTPANYGGVSLGQEGRDAVEVVKLDSLKLERLDFVKIDVEGMEEAVIRGGLDTIKRLRPKLYVENDSGHTRIEQSTSLIRLIRSLGYRLWWHMPPLYQPDNFRGYAQNIFSRNIVSINMLCIREDEMVTTNYVEILTDDAVPNL